jgi:hypothetical protein
MKAVRKPVLALLILLISELSLCMRMDVKGGKHGINISGDDKKL